MKTFRKIIGIVVLSGLVGFVTTCRKENLPGYGSIKVNMTDAPALYTQVDVDIVKVRIHVVPKIGAEEWIDLPTKAGIYDLLALQNGINVNLVDVTKIPDGQITQMRLVLGNNNSVVVDNTIHSLTVPSGNETGIKLIGTIMVSNGQTVNVMMDFKANESIVVTGNGEYQLKPTIEVMP